MTQKEQLMYLIKEYHKGNYQTEIFCDEFTRIMCLEKDDSMSDEERKMFQKADDVFSRFSPFEEDVKTGFLFDEQKVNIEFNNLLMKLEKD